MPAVSQRVLAVTEAMSPFLRLFVHTPWLNRRGEPGVCDFVVGDPHDPPLPDYVAALQRWITPQRNDWYAYQQSRPEAQQVVAESLHRRLDLAFSPDDICMTTGAFAGLAICLNATIDAGDEVIFVTPPWFFYEALIVAAGATPVRVKIDMQTFDLDLDAIAAAITPRTRAILVNTPHNPTGKVLPPATLRRLSQILNAAGERNGRPIYLLSDESYCRILYDGNRHTSPAAFYPYTMVIYTYGKTLLTPGQRMGYVALSPSMPLEDREALRMGLLTASVIAGYTFPNVLLQYAIADLETLCVDIQRLQGRRDRLVAALRSQGYEATLPEGTFYMMVKSPWDDDIAYTNLLAEHDVLCLPGNIVEMPGWFRISLTATDEMVDRAIPRFAAALEAAKQQVV
jgi:aspartate aminotransferase